MRAFVITVQGDWPSEAGVKNLLESNREVGNDFEVTPFQATTPATVDQQMKELNVQWNYPEEEEVFFMKGPPPLKLTAYRTKNNLARRACFLSHYRLWLQCLETNRSILIMEDDAQFVRKLDPYDAFHSGFSIIGINDPRGATRKAGEYHRLVQATKGEVTEAPWIDEQQIPQGLAGASAYLMTPWGAHQSVALTKSLGAWPNDALLCKQNMPGKLGQTRTYYTRVTNMPSSLS